MKGRRVVLIVLDGVGVGALPDAGEYGDLGADTLRHVAESGGGLDLPNLQRLGLGNIAPIPGVAPSMGPSAAFGRMRERSPGKDTTTGHWELAGLVLEKPFATFPGGFPAELIDAFTRLAGSPPLGNIAASGTEIIRHLGEEHLRSGRPIVYTSADSVFQIAAHEEVIPVERLYDLCRRLRPVLDRWRIARVIARPFRGASAVDFLRTPGRHDFSLPPTGPTLLQRLYADGLAVVGIGKIGDIFAGEGLTGSLPTASNAEGMEKTLQALDQVERGLIFTNLVDFDMLYGHRQDAQGFARALQAFDAFLPRLQGRLGADDLLLITADHGCDPTTPGTDHTREHVPLLAWSPALQEGFGLGDRESFADVAATAADWLASVSPAGKSFAGALTARMGRRITSGAG